MMLAPDIWAFRNLKFRQGKLDSPRKGGRKICLLFFTFLITHRCTRRIFPFDGCTSKKKGGNQKNDISNFKFLSVQLVHQPLPVSMEIPCHEADDSEDPVDNHGSPDTDSSHAKPYSENITESNPEQKHGKHGNSHRVAHIIARSKHIGKGKGQWPQNHGQPVMDHYQSTCQLSRLCTQSVNT